MDMVTVVTPGYVIIGVDVDDSLYAKEPIPGITNHTYGRGVVRGVPQSTPNTEVSLHGGRLYPEDGEGGCDVS